LVLYLSTYYNTKLLSTVYTVQIEHCRLLTNTGACADRFAADLTVYCQNVVHTSGFEDVNRYETAVAMLKSAFLRELEELAIDFTAKLIKTSTQKEAKAITLANARVDAEMTDATKPVTETIGEEIKRQFTAQRTPPPLPFPTVTCANIHLSIASPHTT
jgi:hypothetical protein